MMIARYPLRALTTKPPHDWQLIPFGALLAEPVRNGIYKPKEFHGSGACVVNMGELFAYDFISNQDMKRVEISKEEENKFCLIDGDLLFARRSLVLEGSGKCSLVLSPRATTTFESSIIRARPNRELADSRFMFYMFTSPFGRAIIASISSQTAVSGIRGSDLAKVVLPVPPLQEQRRIASILSAYDNLIENNLRRIKILEEQASVLYREWFIEFRFPGHAKTPRVTSEIGSTPKGWEIKKLGDLAEEMRRNVPKGKLDDPRPYVGLEHIPRRSLALDSWEMTTEIGSNKLEFKKGEVLFGKIRPYFHKVSIAPLDGLCSADTIVIRPRHPEHCAIVTAYVSSEDFVAHAAATSNGAKMPRANWNVLKNCLIPLPDATLLSQFTRLFQGLVCQQQLLVFQIHNLRRTRDLLLPRLLNGAPPPASR